MKIKIIVPLVAALITMLTGCNDETTATQNPSISTTVTPNNMADSTVTVKNTSQVAISTLGIQMAGNFTNLNIKPGQSSPCQSISAANPLAPNAECNISIENDQVNEPVNNAVGAITITPASAKSSSISNPKLSGSLVYGPPAIINVKAGTYLYAAGEFTEAGGQAVNRIAMWDGTTWTGLDAASQKQPATNVYSLAVANNELYAGGQLFNDADNIAKWNGENWTTSNTGSSGLIYALAVINNVVYAGGQYPVPSGAVAALSNGLSWLALPGLVTDDQFGSGVYTMISSGNTLYVTGRFLNSNPNDPNDRTSASINKWDGSARTWSNLGVLQGYGPASLAVLGEKLYVGGGISAVNGQAVNNIVEWNGANWSSLGSGANNIVNALAVSNGALYAGGGFTDIGHLISEWNGTNWQPLGTGIAGDDNAQVYALAVSGTDLYAAGTFTTAGGTPANNIAVWNGTSWAPLGEGVNNEVRSLVLAPSLEVSN